MRRWRRRTSAIRDRLKYRGTPKLLLGICLALTFTAVGPAGVASAASAPACASSPSHANCDGAPPGAGCTSGSHYVVVSNPLIDKSGHSSWSYGYVQLWWSDTCQTNWARVVINVTGSWRIQTVVFRFSGSPRDVVTDYDGGAGAYQSGMIYSPDSLACADGDIVTSAGTAYFATASQYSGC
jgi:hypothetical protein